MPRTVNAALLAALSSDSFEMAHLIFLDVGSGIYLTDHASDITYIDLYQASDHLIEVGNTTETQDLKVNTINIGLSGVDQTYISIFLQSNWINKPATIRQVVINNGAIVGSPLTLFQGQITKFSVSENNRTSKVTVSIASHWADFEKKAGRLTNNTSQQYFFPLDLGFQYAAATVKDLKWGRE